MRPLIEATLNIIKTGFREKLHHIIIEAPTGYGKSVSGPVFFKELVELGIVESFIHVLPLRAILRDLYLCTLLASITDITPPMCGNKRPPSMVKDGLKSLSHDEIAYQMGELILGDHLGSYVKKSPLYDARYVVTTIDSFLYNFFRIPVTELMSRRKHYAIPRMRIFISGVYFDEAHFVFEDESQVSSIYTSTLKAIENLAICKVPLIIASATLSEKMINELCSLLRNDCIVVKLGENQKMELHSSSSKIVEVPDRDFADQMASMKWETELINEENVIKEALELISLGLKVLIVRDSVRKAVETYEELTKEIGENRVVLIHGLMTRGDREQALDKILSLKEARVVVSTSVIEAGLDVSFNALITDGSRPQSVIQRAGRVCRYGECDEARVYLVKNSMLDNRLYDFVNNSDNKICWRLPFNYHHYRGYRALVNTLEPPVVDLELKRKLNTLINSLFISGKTINQILRDNDYALVRTGIVEILIKGPGIDAGKEIDFTDLMINSIVLDINRVNKLINEDCIDIDSDGVIVAYTDSDNVYKLKNVCNASEIIKIRGSHMYHKNPTKEFDFMKYIHCIYKGIETIGKNIVYSAIAVKSECYNKSKGLVIE
ncbi:MAG: CRISPR-associated helicase Cas3' [Candidatus Korarchaeota archaeon]